MAACRSGVFIIVSAILLVSASNPSKTGDEVPSNLVNNDHIYSERVKSVQLYIQTAAMNSALYPPISSIQQPHPFLLEFDEINEDARYYQAKIIHCNWDWSPSNLLAIEYMDDYNEIESQSYNYSLNTKVPYTHYRFVLPRLKIPGNFLVYVYDRDNPDNLLLSRRLMIYDNSIKLLPELTYSSGIAERSTNQQINFTLSYQGVNVMNPISDFKVVIRQNYSWHNAITGLQPTQINDQQQTLEYRSFNLENNFQGGNEYRYIDMRSSVSAGRNIERIINKPGSIDAFVAIDKPRGDQPYVLWQDTDGAYALGTLDGKDASTEADYINTHFFLHTGTKISSDVYFFGEITFGELLPEFKMTYDSDLGGYTGSFLLKEGYYEYQYITSANPYEVEGSHFETENTYEIFVYYRPPSRIYDVLGGYTVFKSTGNN